MELSSTILPPPYKLNETRNLNMNPEPVSINIKENIPNSRRNSHISPSMQNILNHSIEKHRHHEHICSICKSKNLNPDSQEVGPYLIHKTHPELITICLCVNRVHPVCIKNTGNKDYTCTTCNVTYPINYNIRIAQFLCFLCHLLSLASVVGLVFGLSYLGRALDELGLGSEIGPKLDGDETWQDHEMLDILEWLNVVHYATGAAGEALLGLVYILGVCLVIGLDQTMIMIANILYLRLDPIQKSSTLPRWFKISCIYITLFILGLALGTYLLFFSWIWASVLRHLQKRILNYKEKPEEK